MIIFVWKRLLVQPLDDPQKGFFTLDKYCLLFIFLFWKNGRNTSLWKNVSWLKNLSVIHKKAGKNSKMIIFLGRSGFSLRMIHKSAFHTGQELIKKYGLKHCFCYLSVTSHINCIAACCLINMVYLKACAFMMKLHFLNDVANDTQSHKDKKITS